MKYLLFFILLIMLYLVLSSLKQKPQQKQLRDNSFSPEDINTNSTEDMRVISRDENEKGLLIKLDVDGIYFILGQLYKDGNPWIDIRTITGKDSINDYLYRYNVKTFRWRNDDLPDGSDLQSKINRILRYEWIKYWEQCGRPEPENKRKKPEIVSSVNYISKELNLKYDPATLQSLPDKYQVTGSSGQVYDLNLKQLACSCPDFIKRRSSYPFGDIRRCCKHLAKSIVGLGKNTKLTNDSKIKAFIRSASLSERGVTLYHAMYEVTIREAIRGPHTFWILSPSGDDQWAEIIFFTDRTYVKHGYNIIEKRWGYHDNPFPAGSRQKYNLVVQNVLGLK